LKSYGSARNAPPVTPLIYDSDCHFEDKAIEISIREDIDETDYLMREPANRYYLRNELKNLNDKTNLIKIPANDYDELVKNLLRK
jgi:hypothetical protein